MKNGTARTYAKWTYGVVVAIVFIAISVPTYEHFRYQRLQSDTFDLLRSLKSKCPPSEEPEEWRNATGWLSTAFANAVTEETVPYDKLSSYSQELRRRLANDELDRSTIEWAWKKLGCLSPDSQDYIDRWAKDFKGE